MHCVRHNSCANDLQLFSHEAHTIGLINVSYAYSAGHFKAGPDFPGYGYVTVSKRVRIWLFWGPFRSGS